MSQDTSPTEEKTGAETPTPDPTPTPTPEAKGTLSAVAATGTKGTLAAVAATEPAKKEEPKWFLADGIPGVGDAPEWFKADKYKTAEEQAKAFVGLEKKLGAAPAEYELILPKDITDAGGAIDPEAPLTKDFLDFARSANLPQKKVNELLEIYARSQMAQANQTVTEMLSELGDKGRQVAREIHSWSIATLDSDQQKWLDGALASADDIYAFQSILQKFGKGASSDRTASSGLNSVSEVERLEAEIAGDMKDPRYTSDASFEKIVRGKFARLVELEQQAG